MADLRRTVGLLEQTLAHQTIGLDEARGLLKVITDYAYALTTLDRFDHLRCKGLIQRLVKAGIWKDQ